MKGNFKAAFSDKIITTSLNFSLFLMMISSVLIALFYTKLPPFIPFFNSLPWGGERLAPSYYLIFLPVFFVLILIVNSIISVRVYTSYTLLSRILSVNALLFVLFGFLALIQIIFLVF